MKVQHNFSLLHFLTPHTIHMSIFHTHHSYDIHFLRNTLPIFLVQAPFLIGDSVVAQNYDHVSHLEAYTVPASFQASPIYILYKGQIK